MALHLQPPSFQGGYWKNTIFGITELPTVKQTHFQVFVGNVEPLLVNRVTATKGRKDIAPTHHQRRMGNLRHQGQQPPPSLRAGTTTSTVGGKGSCGSWRVQPMFAVGQEKRREGGSTATSSVNAMCMEATQGEVLTSVAVQTEEEMEDG